MTTDQPAPTRVHVIAFACEPGRGSEPGVGYAYAEALAQLTRDPYWEITLVTRPHRIDAIRDALERDGEHRLKLDAVPLPSWLVRITGRRRVRIAYIVWQSRVVRRIRSLPPADAPQIVHHLTFSTEALPTFEWLLPRSIARVFGPAGSSQELNRKLRRGPRQAIRHLVRTVAGRWNLRSVDLALAQNDFAAAAFTRLGCAEVRVSPNVVVRTDVARDAVAGAHGFRRENRLVTAGLLTELKRTELAVRVMDRLRDLPVTLDVIGDGPELAALQNLTRSLGLEQRITFLGMLPRREAIARVARSQVLLHPSRQEGAGWVVGEAQAVGTVPIVFAGSGADTVVRLGGSGVVVMGQGITDLEDAVREALNLRASPTEVWSEAELARRLGRLYRDALELAHSRAVSRPGAPHHRRPSQEG